VALAEFTRRLGIRRAFTLNLHLAGQGFEVIPEARLEA
jgi:hypothetical protein